MIRRALEDVFEHTEHARQRCAEDISRKDGPDLVRLHNGDPGEDGQEYQSYYGKNKGEQRQPWTSLARCHPSTAQPVPQVHFSVTRSPNYHSPRIFSVMVLLKVSNPRKKSKQDVYSGSALIPLLGDALCLSMFE